MSTTINADRETNSEAVVRAHPTSEKACAASHPLPTLNDIHQRAWRKWVLAGKPSGNTFRFWLEAEQELLHEN